jgi:hypothetical protein
MVITNYVVPVFESMVLIDIDEGYGRRGVNCFPVVESSVHQSMVYKLYAKYFKGCAKNIIITTVSYSNIIRQFKKEWYC